MATKQNTGDSGASVNHQAENAGICRILRRDFQSVVRAAPLLDVAVCAEIATGIWKRTATCMGAQHYQGVGYANGKLIAPRISLCNCNLRKELTPKFLFLYVIFGLRQ